jgi:hypothetical protein
MKPEDYAKSREVLAKQEKERDVFLKAMAEQRNKTV